MPTLQALRADNPSYKRYSDAHFMKMIAEDSGMSIDEVHSKLGYQPEAAPEEPVEEPSMLDGVVSGTKKALGLSPEAFVNPPTDTSNKTISTSDSGKLLEAGFGNLVSGVGYITEILGGDKVGKTIREYGNSRAKFWNESLSEAGQNAAKEPIFVDDEDSIFGLALGKTPVQSAIAMAAQSAPSMFAAAIPGALAAKATQGLAKLGLAAGIGGSGAVVPLLAGTAAPVGVAGNIAARAPSALGFGAAEGLAAGGMNAAALKSSIEGMNKEELMKSPVYAALAAEHGDDIAKILLAEQASLDLFGKTTLSTGAIGVLTGGGALAQAYQKATAGAKGGILTQSLKGVGAEALQEAPQSAGETLIGNINERDFLDPTKTNTMEGVLADAASGAVVGGLLGGVAGGGGAVLSSRSRADRINEERTRIGLNNIAAASSVDEAISAANDTVSNKPVTAADVAPKPSYTDELLRRTQEQGTDNETTTEEETEQDTEAGVQEALPEQVEEPKKEDKPVAESKQEVQAPQEINEDTVDDFLDDNPETEDGAIQEGASNNFDDLSEMASFAGENSKTAGKGLLDLAKKETAAGKDAEQTRKDTGWFQGADKKWRYEINDKPAKLNSVFKKDESIGAGVDRLKNESLKDVTVGDVLSHDELFKAYPSLAAIKVKVVNTKGVHGSFNPDNNTISIGKNVVQHKTLGTNKNVVQLLLHEMQHAIQAQEHFARGGSTSSIAADPVKYAKESELAFAESLFTKPNATPEEKQQFLEEYFKVMDIPSDTYRRLAGEVEARNVEARQKLTPKQRKDTPPSKTQDVKDEDSVVVFNDEVSLDYSKFHTRPDTKESHRDIGRSAYKDILKTVGDRLGGKVLGSVIAKDFKETGATSLIGKQVKTTEDLAVLAQIVRDPRFETFRVFYVKNEQIIHHSAMSSRLPNIIRMGDLDEVALSIKNTMQESGADGYYLMHNHPSGDASPSYADKDVTRSLKKAVPGMKAHIIIDTNEYGVLGDGDSLTDMKPRVVKKELVGGYTGGDSIPHNVLRKKVTSYGEFAKLAKLVQRKDEFFIVFALGAKSEVSAIAEVPNSALDKSNLYLGAAMRNFARHSGTERLVVVADKAHLSKFDYAVNAGLLEQASDFEGNTSVSSQNRGNVFGILSNNAPKLSSNESLTGLPIAVVEKAIAPLKLKWKGFTDIKVVASFDSLPQVVRDRLLSKHGEGVRTIDGIYAVKEEAVFLIADQIPTTRRAMWVAVHETVGHAGLRKIDKSVAESIAFASKNKHVNDLAKAIAKDRKETYNHDIHIQEALAELTSATLTGDVKHIFRQYGVNVPENVTRSVQGMIQRIVEAIRKFFANMKGVVTDAQINELIRATQRAIEEGNSTPVAVATNSPQLDVMSKKDTILVDGVERPTKNSEGKAIHPTEEGVINFWKWFGDSKVVDKQGRPQVVYHGTTKDFDTFKSSEIDPTIRGLGGFHFTSEAVRAKGFSGVDGGNIMPMYLSATNPEALSIESIRYISKEYGKYGSDNLVKDKTTEGIDGFVIDNNHYVVFESNQAKSAVGNDGSFSKEEDIILLSTRTDKLNAAGVNTNTTPPTNNNPLPDDPNEIRVQGQDNMLRTKDLAKWGKEQGIVIPDSANIYERENLSKAQVANKIEDFRQYQLEPIIKDIGKSGFTLADMTTYLEAVHIPEANARIQEINKDVNATANGITTEQAEAVIEDFKAMKDFKKFEALATRIRDIAKETLQNRLNAGLITQEQFDNYNNVYKNWVPLRGNVSKKGFGKGLSTHDKDKRRFGHAFRDEEFVLEHIVSDRERSIHVIEKNKVVLAVIDFLLTMDNKEIGTVSKPVKNKAVKDFTFTVSYQGNVLSAFDTKAAAEKAKLKLLSTGVNLPGARIDPNDVVVEKTYDPHVVITSNPMLAENEIQGYINGHAIKVQLNDPSLARALTKSNIGQLAGILHAARMFNNYLSKAYTAWSPDFLFINPIRDLYSGMIVNTGKEGVGFAAKAFANYPKMMSELWKSREDPLSSSWVTRYRDAGGNTGAAYMSDLDRVGTDALEKLHEYAGAKATYEMVYKEAISRGLSKKKAHASAFLKAGGAKAQSLPVAGHFLRLMTNLNGVTENALRLATFKAAIEAGKTDQQAAVLAKDLMNFNRKGEQTNQLGALYLFFNPAMQGAHIVAEAMMSPHRKQVFAILGGLTAASYLLAEMARGEDEDDWDKTPRHIKERNMIIKVGDSQYTIPVAYGFGVFHSLGLTISDVQHGMDIGKASINMAQSLLDNFSVVGNPFIEDGDRTNIQLGQIAPTAIKTIMAPSTNLDGLGRPITPQSFTDDVPDSQMMFRSTRGTVYETLAAMMNGIDGDAYTPGTIDVSPNTLKYWFTTLTGGAGRAVVDVGDGIAGAGQGVAPDLENIPVLRKFVRSNNVNHTRAAFWEAAKKARAASARFNRATKDGEYELAEKMWDENSPIIELAKFSREVSKMTTALRNQVQEIQASDKSRKDKKAAIKILEEEEENIYDEFIKQFPKNH